MFVRMRAFAPTPVAGPESDQSTRKWSVNCSWLPSTSRKANTPSRGRGTVVVETIGFMWDSGEDRCRKPRECAKIATQCQHLCHNAGGCRARKPGG